jgi:hypothetical protein
MNVKKIRIWISTSYLWEKKEPLTRLALTLMGKAIPITALL